MKLLKNVFNHFLLYINEKTDFVFKSIDEMHYKCNKISLNCGGSDWEKKFSVQRQSH